LEGISGPKAFVGHIWRAPKPREFFPGRRPSPKREGYRERGF